MPDVLMWLIGGRRWVTDVPSIKSLSFKEEVVGGKVLKGEEEGLCANILTCRSI